MIDSKEGCRSTSPPSNEGIEMDMSLDRRSIPPPWHQVVLGTATLATFNLQKTIVQRELVVLDLLYGWVDKCIDFYKYWLPNFGEYER